MKKILLASLALPSLAWAQPTITSASFPAAGDVLMISTAAADSGEVVTASSPLAQFWDFSQLSTTGYREETVSDAQSGLNFVDFPSTEIIQPLIANIGTAYIDVTNTAVTRIGAGIELFGFSFVGPYTDPHTLQTAPLNIAGNRTDNFDIRFGEHIDSIPFLRQIIDQLAGSLPGGVTPDSIRIRINGSRNMYNEAHGTVALYDGNYTVLRQRVNEITNTGIEVRVSTPMFPTAGYWFDVTPLIAGQLPVSIPTTDTTIYYDYLAEGYKQAIVRQYMESDGRTVRNYEFKGQNITPVKPLTSDFASSFSAYPNPAPQQTLRLRFPDNNIPNYTFSLTTIDGKELSRLQNLSGGEHEISISHIQTSGIYIAKFIAPSGQVLHAQRLQIIR